MSNLSDAEDVIQRITRTSMPANIDALHNLDASGDNITPENRLIRKLVMLRLALFAAMLREDFTEYKLKFDIYKIAVVDALDFFRTRDKPDIEYLQLCRQSQNEYACFGQTYCMALFNKSIS